MADSSPNGVTKPAINGKAYTFVEHTYDARRWVLPKPA
jgi:hypothetical protein